jgi:hypothetical protein
MLFGIILGYRSAMLLAQVVGKEICARSAHGQRKSFRLGEKGLQTYSLWIN